MDDLRSRHSRSMWNQSYSVVIARYWPWNVVRHAVACTYKLHLVKRHGVTWCHEPLLFGSYCCAANVTSPYGGCLSRSVNMYKQVKRVLRFGSTFAAKTPIILPEALQVSCNRQAQYYTNINRITTSITCGRSGSTPPEQRTL